MVPARAPGFIVRLSSACRHSASTRSSAASISLPNDTSIRLHEKLGFTQVAHLAQVGYKFGRWVDVGYWQRLMDE